MHSFPLLASLMIMAGTAPFAPLARDPDELDPFDDEGVRVHKGTTCGPSEGAYEPIVASGTNMKPRSEEQVQRMKAKGAALLKAEQKRARKRAKRGRDAERSRAGRKP